MKNFIKINIRSACILVLSSVALASPPDASKTSRQLLGHMIPHSSFEINKSPWGIQIGSLESSHVEKAAAIGVKWTRLNGSWREIEKEKGVYSWEETDKAYTTALKNGITPFICLAGSSRLYCEKSADNNPRDEEIYGKNLMPPTKSPQAMEAWLKFVSAVVSRYKSDIRYWEIWNEPNHWAYWGAPPDGNEYGILVRETAKAIRKIDPSAKIIAGALAGLDPAFTEKFLSGEAAQLIDIISFHNYGSIPEERIYKAIETWDVINKNNPKLELWQGECGYPSHSSTRDYRGTSPWGPVIQAKWLLRQSFTDVYFCRTTMSNYFKLVHMGGRAEMPKRSFLTPIDSVLGFPDRNGARVKSIGVNEKCILSNPDLQPKPAYAAYQNLCAVFDERYSRTEMKPKIIINDPGIFYGIGSEDDSFPSIPLVAAFRSKNGNDLFAYWLPWHPLEMINEGTVTLRVKGAAFTSPALINLLNGAVYDVTMKTAADGEMEISGLPLADFPYIIADKKEIEFK